MNFYLYQITSANSSMHTIDDPIVSKYSAAFEVNVDVDAGISVISICKAYHRCNEDSHVFPSRFFIIPTPTEEDKIVMTLICKHCYTLPHDFEKYIEGSKHKNYVYYCYMEHLIKVI